MVSVTKRLRDEIELTLTGLGVGLTCRKSHLVLVSLAIVHPDGSRTILSRALLDADFGPARLRAGAYVKLNLWPKKARTG